VKDDDEYVLDVSMWRELYPGLTERKVQKAAKELDKSRPGWRNDKREIDILIAMVLELNPELSKRRRQSGQRRKRARTKGNGALILIIVILLYALWKHFHQSN
jgi:hypothetical protein